MREQIDPKQYGLPPRTRLLKKGPKEFILVVNRKSRLIMKDAETIIEKVARIKEKISHASVSLETTAPVCSKSMRFLNENGIKVLKVA